ncbi:hypothetical protein [Actinoplanes sp. NPDC051494]|uniref:hypothetical protein n=1 Tax=Actinoplanes sp. NPDC051494 TaxID=3363907 RepID=UPI0037BCBCB0
MRLTPGSAFLVIVALGFPFAVASGWILGSMLDSSEEPPPVAEVAIAGSGGIGSAPTEPTTAPATRAVDWTPRTTTKHVAVIESVSPSAVPSVSALSSSPVPSSSPSAVVSLTPSIDVPVPTPTQAGSGEPSPSPSASPESPPPPPSGLGGILGRS